MRARKVAVAIEEENPSSVEDKVEEPLKTQSVEPEIPKPEQSAEDKKSEAPAPAEPEAKPKKKRTMTEAKREALRKANEARAIKRKEKMEKNEQEKRRKEEEKLESKILEILQKQKPATPSKPPKDAIRPTPAAKRRVLPRKPAEPIERRVYYDDSSDEEDESSEDEPVVQREIPRAAYRPNPVEERHSRMFSMIFRH